MSVGMRARLVLSRLLDIANHQGELATLFLGDMTAPLRQGADISPRAQQALIDSQRGNAHLPATLFDFAPLPSM
jgi:hypothetical protein